MASLYDPKSTLMERQWWCWIHMTELKRAFTFVDSVNRTDSYSRFASV